MLADSDRSGDAKPAPYNAKSADPQRANAGWSVVRSGAAHLQMHPRYHVHFTPTSASWLNQIEPWFAEITRKRIRSGTFGSVRDLERAIREYILETNKNPKPFRRKTARRKFGYKTQSFKRSET